MSNQTNQSLTVQLPLWKQGKYPGMEFCSSWSRLEKEQPDVWKMLPQVAGTETVDHEYSYKVYATKYGLSIGRRKLDIEKIKEVATALPTKKIVIPDMKQVDDKPPARPPMEDPKPSEIQELTKAILILADVMKNQGSYMGGGK